MVAYRWHLVYTKSVCVIADHRVAHLSSQAVSRMNSALRPRTKADNIAKIKHCLAFILTSNLLPTELDTILAFLELLAQSGSRAQTLASYISVLCHFFQLRDLDCKLLPHRKIQLLLKDVSCNTKCAPRFKATLTIDNLVNLAAACGKIKHGPVYKVAYLLAFYTFLRISNVAPPTARAFHVTCHIVSSDLILGWLGAQLILKCGKAMQSVSSHHVVQLPALPSSPICQI